MAGKLTAVRRLAQIPQMGAKVVIADVSNERGKGVVRGAGSLCVPTDCMDGDATAADAALARIGANYQLCFNFLDHTGVSL